MQGQTLIGAQHLGKCYRVYNRHLDHLKEVLSLGRRHLSQEFWALREVSLQVKKGEAVGNYWRERCREEHAFKASLRYARACDEVVDPYSENLWE